MKPLLLMRGAADNDFLLWLIFVAFLVLVVVGQAFARWIFHRFFHPKQESEWDVARAVDE